MDSDNSTSVKLQRRLGLFNGVALIVGTIVGSGIFVSPKGVLRETGSIGLALIVWGVAGIICLLGALCYAELGTCIRKSGGTYAYLYAAFGPLPAFLYLCVSVLVIGPAGNAIIALTFGYYAIQPFYPSCEQPDAAVRLLAAVAICVLTFVNCVSVKWASRIQDVFTVIKVLALVIIIITGMVQLCKGRTENMEKPFENTTDKPGALALAFYSGLFSYSGWNTLNFLTEELKDPYRNLPYSVWISMPLVTVIYVLANLAYFVVLLPAEILQSDAVAVTFAEQMLGPMAWVMPVFVAFSTFGSLNGCILAISRIFFVGAREGHFPDVLALINTHYYTPITSVLFETVVTLLMLCTSDVYKLINYCMFMESGSYAASVAALLWLRYKCPDMERPIKVPIIIPIIFMLCQLFLMILPIYSSPIETGIGLLVLVAGFPAYFIGVVWKNKPQFYRNFVKNLTIGTQKVFMCVKQDGKID